MIWPYIVGSIIDRIEEGTYQPGDKLPDPRVLGLALDVSDQVVKKAYNILIERGYVVKHAHFLSGWWVRVRR